MTSTTESATEIRPYQEAVNRIVDVAFVLLPKTEKGSTNAVDFKFVCANPSALRHLDLSKELIFDSGLRSGVLGSFANDHDLRMFNEAYFSGLPLQYRRESTFTGKTQLVSLHRFRDAVMISLRPIESEARTVCNKADVFCSPTFENSIAHFLRLWDSTHAGLALADKDGKLIHVSSSLVKMLGYGADELIGKSLVELTHPEDRSKGVHEYRCLTSGKIDQFRAEKRYLRKDGSSVPVRIAAACLTGKKDGAEDRVSFAVVKEIDTLSDESIRIQKKETLLKSLLDDLPIAVGACNERAEIIFVNRMLRECLGYPEEFFIGKSIVGVVHPNQTGSYVRFHKELHGSSPCSHQVELSILCGDGQWRWFRLAGHVVARGPNSESIAMVTCRNIEDERSLAAQLTLSEEKIRTVVETDGIILFSYDSESRITFLTGTPLTRINLNPDQVLGLAALEVFQDDPNICGAINKSLLGIQHQVLVQRNGRWFDVHIFPVCDQQSPSKVIRVAGMAIDVTDREAARKLVDLQREALVKSAKLAALGQMAAGISHEINNPLTVIYGYACSFKNSINRNEMDFDSANTALDEIIHTSERIEKIIDGLRAFSRESSNEPVEPVSVAEVVRDTLSFCEQRIKNHGITLLLHDDQFDVQVLGRPVQISEILLNLLNNAFDAVVGQKGEQRISIQCAVEGNFAAISICDSGPGFAEEARERIFEPFFSTKPPGAGTGLGLSVSKGLAEANGGTLHFERLDDCTRFIVRLPLAPLIVHTDR